MEVEYWKPYVCSTNGLEYAVSSYGRLFSQFSGRYLTASVCNSGYLQFGSAIGSQHRLVVSTFLGSIPKEYQVNHIDGVKTNNHVSNLEVVTAAENMQHAVRTGLKVGQKGVENGMSVLEETDILTMYDMFKVGASNKDVALRFGVHDRYVSLIRHGHRWSYLYKARGDAFPKSYKFKFNKSLIVLAHNLIGDGLRNTEVSRITGIERSMISRIRSGSCYKDFIESYNKILNEVNNDSNNI